MSVKLLLLCLALLVLVARLLLDWLNLRYQKQHGCELPPLFANRIDVERLRLSNEYSRAKGQLGLIEEGSGGLLMLIFLFSGIFPWYDQLVQSTEVGPVVEGLLFFALLGLVQVLLGIPFSLYRNFVLEARFGFNRMSFGLWCADLLKSLLVGGILFVLLIGGALLLVQAFPLSWWLWVWAFWALLTLFLLYLSPVLIEPLFYKMTPLADESLAEQVRLQLQKVGLQAGKVLQVDASRRSGHSNAYFTGIGRVKRVVFFDTLLEQLNEKEILAVLAHELGHWQCGHIRQRLIQGQLVILACCYGGFLLLQKQSLVGWFGLEQLSFAGQVMLLGWFGSLMGFFWTPVSSWWSRRQERQADSFAVNLVGGGRDLATGLVSLAKENLSQLHPHPLYSRIYYSHPPLLERVAWLERKDG
ncbi:MAG TPA: M48 family metallopeptidase [Geopsychrobacteraceae bacterium]|nr:M48 family metallopeptidase [Geopsychrobacteraceae bacterium]